jgi:carbamoyl-phosphate synthase large subunit
MLTVPVSLQKRLQEAAYKIVESIEVIGGTNVQFAHDPETDRVVIIEINPRTSRSSALASKATGFPIALISAKLAAGMTMDELPYWRDGSLEKYTPGGAPDGDYIVLKFARWAFEKFRGVEDSLGTQMKAVGEVMAIGRTFKETFQKAIRGLENGRSGLGFAKDFNRKTLQELLDMLRVASSERYFILYEALRKGADIRKLHELTFVKEYFLEQMKELVELEEELLKNSGRLPADDLLIRAKRDGFSDKYLAKILGLREKDVRRRRTELGVVENWLAVPVSGTENTNYYYSTYNAPEKNTRPEQVSPSGRPDLTGRKKILILGGGPNRIGQGIEFDYCCVHAAFALRELGYETIMVNCNPETVSTDYDTSDTLYFEPVTLEDVLQIYEREKPEGVIVQFGGQTPLNIARQLSDEGVKILGTSIDSIDIAEDRDLFRKMMDQLGIPMPEAGMASDIDEAVSVANSIGYPIMIRPSFVLGGRGMEVIYDENMLREYVAKAVGVTPDRPLLLDRFLRNALECEADALSDGTDVYIPSVMEHIELAGVHSGDSACMIPPVSIGTEQLESIKDYTRKIAHALRVCGLMNMQYAIEDGKVYVLEANPRASRTVPLVSKVCNTQMARLATRLMLGEKLGTLNLKEKSFSHFGAKEAVFPFDKFPEVDPVLGPEMRSTGEVLGLSENFALAFYKSQEAAGVILPTDTQGAKVLVSLSDKDNLMKSSASVSQAVSMGKTLSGLGFSILATEGTAAFFREHGVECEVIAKLNEGRPNVIDIILNRQVSLVINTPAAQRDAVVNEAVVRKAAIKYKIPYITTLAAASAAVQGIAAARSGKGEVKSLQEYHARITEG